MLSVNPYFDLLVVAITVISGVAAGAVMHSLWSRRSARKRMTIPTDWPLNPRPLANTEERKVWVWLCEVFYNHHVTIKTPVTRFTLPREPEQGQYWYNMLSSVYCTLTICGQDGRVIGCVDVLGRKGLSRSNWRLKRSLLSQCDMAYIVIEPESLPTPAKIRTLFLGKEAALQYARELERDEIRISAARLKLSAALERQRRSRSGEPEHSNAIPSNQALAPERGFREESSFDASSDFDTSTDFGDEWQKNSFLAPLDSCYGDLRK